MQPADYDERTAVARDHMVRTQIEARGVTDPRVLEAMRRVPRHRFVPEGCLLQAHEDHPIPLGGGQTISQPYIVAYMAEALCLEGHERVLEVGSGCGYMASVLSLLVKDVYGLELLPALHARAASLVDALGYDNIHLGCGDGRGGWPGKAPFDAILLSCAADHVPPPLWEQLAEGGRMILPLGTPYGYQMLVLLTKREGVRDVRDLIAVSFVPLL
ncbi:MAG TPA: protein-L-isoaspartate(D-aspartate) O-methyltransferase [Holophaga sp.]|nr:protein-L-isoaspartate(D-aspartate) O-methyltransferase [Holophaga sp.]